MATRSSQYGKRVWLAKPSGKRKTAGKSDEESDEEGRAHHHCAIGRKEEAKKHHADISFKI